MNEHKNKSIFSLQKESKNKVTTREYCNQLCYLESHLRFMLIPRDLKNEEEKEEFQKALEQLKDSIEKLWMICIKNNTSISFNEGFIQAKNNIVPCFY